MSILLLPLSTSKHHWKLLVLIQWGCCKIMWKQIVGSEFLIVVGKDFCAKRESGEVGQYIIFFIKLKLIYRTQILTLSFRRQNVHTNQTCAYKWTVIHYRIQLNYVVDMFLSKGRTKNAFDSPLRKPPTLEPDFIISNYSESSDNCSFDDGTDDDTHDDRLWY